MTDQFDGCMGMIEGFKKQSEILKYPLSLQSTLAFMLVVLILYNICRYLYNEPRKTKDKLTIILYFLFVVNVLCKEPTVSHPFLLVRVGFCVCFLYAYKLPMLNALDKSINYDLLSLYRISVILIGMSDFLFQVCAVIQIAQV